MARNYVMASAVRSSRFKTEQLGAVGQIVHPGGRKGLSHLTADVCG